MKYTPKLARRGRNRGCKSTNIFVVKVVTLALGFSVMTLQHWVFQL